METVTINKADLERLFQIATEMTEEAKKQCELKEQALKLCHELLETIEIIRPK